MRVYAVLVSHDRNTVGVNLKDSTLPTNLLAYEGLIGLFGGAIEDGESPSDALIREIKEEIPGFIPEVESGNMDNVHYMGLYNDPAMNDSYHLYAIMTDLSGHRKTRATDRIGQLARVCLEGDAVVRTFSYISQLNEKMFVTPIIKKCILDIRVDTFRCHVIDSYGNKYWKNDKGYPHREGGPAVELANGYKAWWVNGVLHREDGPAVEYANGIGFIGIDSYGTKYWKNKDRQYHREDGPAREFADGSKAWYLNGLFHRLDGPAIERADGIKYWWINGQLYTEEEFNKALSKMNQNIEQD